MLPVLKLKLQEWVAFKGQLHGFLRICMAADRRSTYKHPFIHLIENLKGKDLKGRCAAATGKANASP